MSKAAFCAYGAAQTLAALQQLETGGADLYRGSPLGQSSSKSMERAGAIESPLTPSLSPLTKGGEGEGSGGMQVPQVGTEREEADRNIPEEIWYQAAVRLHTCLTLFAPCFPRTRLAFWKRRLRRLIRALNALRDHQHLLQFIPKGRVRLRLQQRIEMQLSKAQQAWQRIQHDHVLNEIRGLSRRLAGTTSEPAPTEIADYARARWQELWRVNLKSLESAGQSVEVRWGRLQLMLTVAQMLAPLLPNEIPLGELQARYQQLSVERFRQRARALLTELKEQERQLTLLYHGSLRGFRSVEQEFDKWIASSNAL